MVVEGDVRPPPPPPGKPSSIIKPGALSVGFPQAQLTWASKTRVQLGNKCLACNCKGYPVAQIVKKQPAVQETWVRSLGWKIPLKNGYPLQYSCLENPMEQRAWLATVHGMAKSWTHLNNFHFSKLAKGPPHPQRTDFLLGLHNPLETQPGGTRPLEQQDYKSVFQISPYTASSPHTCIPEHAWKGKGVREGLCQHFIHTLINLGSSCLFLELIHNTSYLLFTLK